MNNRPTTLSLPGHLPYPITITSLLLQAETTVKKHDGLLVYKFIPRGEEEVEEGEERPPTVKETFEQFDSPWEGILTEWHVKEGSVVNNAWYGSKMSDVDFSESIVSIIEPCLHEISFKDICAICGTDLSVYRPPCSRSLMYRRDYTSEVSTQPNISMSHDNFDVKVT